MDTNHLLLLTVDLERQLLDIAQIYQKLNDRAQRLNPDDPIVLESIAYQIHNFYCAVEDLLKIVAHYFENHITDQSQWHQALLRRMAIAVPEVRPAFLSEVSYQILNPLRGFRHFFRHAYGANIDPQQLESNLERVRQLWVQLQKDHKIFIDQLSPSNAFPKSTE